MGSRYMIVNPSSSVINMTDVYSLNETAAYLWKELENKDFSVEDMCGLLVSKYDVSQETASADASALASKWMEIGIVE